MKRVLSMVVVLCMVFSLASAVFAAEDSAPNIHISTSINGVTVETSTVDGEIVTTTTTDDKASVTNAAADAPEKEGTLHSFLQEICSFMKFDPEQSEEVKTTECKLIQALKEFVFECVREYIKTHPEEVRKMLDEAAVAEMKVSAEETASAASITEAAEDAPLNEEATDITAQEVLK